MSDTYLPVVVRAWPDTDRPAPGRNQTARPVDQVIVFDTETTTDPSQRLNFGCFRYYKRNPFGTWACHAEGLIYADDLPTRNPDGFATLRQYADNHTADVDIASRGALPELLFVSRAEFANQWIYDKGYRSREQQHLEPATIVGFNLPFDLSRIAVDVGYGRKGYTGGFSFTLFTRANGQVNWHRPRVAVKKLNSHQALIGFTGSPTRDGRDTNDVRAFRGHFLDLHTLVFALTGRSHSLKSAGYLFGCAQQKTDTAEHGVITHDYIGYCRQDVASTAELYDKTMAEFRRHPIDKPASAMFSTASVAKAYLRAMGITPPMDRMPNFPRDVLGYATASFYGGRAEVHIRNTPLPVSVNDFTSMYPTVNALMGLWGLLTHDGIDVVDATDDVNALLASVTVDDMLNPDTWRGLVGIGEIIPQGDVVPVRAEYDAGSSNIGINRLTTDHPMWYTIPDLVAATLLGDTVPVVRRAYRFVPAGDVLETLRPVSLRGDTGINPATDDFFVAVVEAKQRAGHNDNTMLRQFCKLLANTGSYGIYGEFIRDDTADTVTHLVHSAEPEPWEHTTDNPETPGLYCFPPISTLITGAARLMLAVLERLVTDAGGTYVFCDTDSMAIVADEGGGLYPCNGGTASTTDGRPAARALTYGAVSGIRERFRSLIPYDPDLVSDLIVEEHRGRCYAISAKRYALYNVTSDGRPVNIIDGTDGETPDDVAIDKTSEHGLGHLLNPTDPTSEDKNWRRLWWEPIITGAEGQQHPGLPWLTRPAMSRLVVSNPDYHQGFATWNDGKSYQESVKPFNFLLTPNVYDDMGYRHPAVSARFRLMAPYAPDATQWLTMDYRNMYDPTSGPYRVTAQSDDGHVPDVSDPVRIHTYGDMFTKYVLHPERKYDGAGGKPCGYRTTGVLSRRSVKLDGKPKYIGKESNFLDERAAGLLSASDVTTDYTADDDEQWRRRVIPVLSRYTARELATVAGVSDRQIRHITSGAGNPGDAVRRTLNEMGVKAARTDLSAAGISVTETDPMCVLAAWAEQCAANAVRGCAECGATVDGRARYCGKACQKRAERARKWASR